MSVPRNTPFTVRASHDGVDTVKYQLAVNGAVTQEQPVGALAAGVIAFPVAAGLAKGSYDLTVIAVGEVLPNAVSDPLTLIVLAKPAGKPTIVSVLLDGA